MKKSVELSHVLGVFNLLVYLATIIFYLFFPFPRVVDWETLIIFTLLAAQVQFFLSPVVCRRNPFIIVLVFVMIAHYMTRIVTLYVSETVGFHGVLERLTQPTVLDVNESLLFIFFANLLIYFGLVGFKKIDNKYWADLTISVDSLRLSAAIIMAVLIVISAFNVAKINFLSGILTYIFSPYNIILIVFVLLFSQPKPFVSNVGYRLLLLLLIVCYMLFLTIGGSRQALLFAIDMLFFTLLAANFFVLQRKYVWGVLACIATGAILFPIATFLRVTNKTYNLDDTGFLALIPQLLESLQLLFENTAELTELFMNVGPFLERVSFLDFVIDMIKNSTEYRYFVNVENGIKSIVDSLTPGFDIFDISKLSNGLSGIYADGPEKFQRINDLSYHSDQFGVYGGYYTVFYGWLSLPFFYVSSRLFVLLYQQSVHISSAFRRAVYMTFILRFYYNWLISFGFDWDIIYFVLDCISIYALVLFVEFVAEQLSLLISYRKQTGQF